VRRVNHVTKPKKGNLSPDAKYGRVSDVTALFGLGKPIQYLYAKRGWITMVHLRPPGAKRGVTLVDLGSVQALIERHKGKPITTVESGGEK
jgi:hypothetical protein